MATTAITAGPITQFINKHYRHFNSATLKDASEAYNTHIAAGGKMLVTLAGAMSSAELGISLAEMIRAGKIHAIPLAPEPMIRKLGLIYRKDKALSKAALGFIHVMLEHFGAPDTAAVNSALAGNN